MSPALHALCWILCMALSLVKVAFIDLHQLSGIHLLGSIVLLGLSSIGVSFTLRRRTC